MESLQNLQTSISAVPPQLRHIGQHALPKLHVAVVGRLARVVPLEHREQLCVLILLKEYGERYIYITNELFKHQWFIIQSGWCFKHFFHNIWDNHPN
jgi:hypothetical protein